MYNEKDTTVDKKKAKKISDKMGKINDDKVKIKNALESRKEKDNDVIHLDGSDDGSRERKVQRVTKPILDVNKDEKHGLEEAEEGEGSEEEEEDNKEEDMCVVCCLPLQPQAPGFDGDGMDDNNYNESVWRTEGDKTLTTICLGHGLGQSQRKSQSLGLGQVQGEEQIDTTVPDIIHCDWCHGSFHLACVGLSIPSLKGFWKCQYCIIFENNEDKRQTNKNYRNKSKNKNKNKNKDVDKMKRRSVLTVIGSDGDGEHSEENTEEYSRCIRSERGRNKARVNYEDKSSSESEERDEDEDEDEEEDEDDEK